MGTQPHIILLSLLSISAIANAIVTTDSMKDAFTPTYALKFLNRSHFPSSFKWGAASAAYQVEGGATEGRGPSIWDTFTHNHPEKIADRSNGDVACDSYHKYKEDVQMLKHLNMDAYRFSISWSRLIPRGKLSGGVSKEGIAYYNNLINELLANGLEPYVTLYHWDVPQALEDEYLGFLSEKIVDDFRDYVDLCFKTYGDRVKHWITFNEPWSFAGGGYVVGALAPGRCSAWVGNNCSAGDSGREPYTVAHNQLLAHAAAVEKYRTVYQKSQNGEIGITLVTTWVRNGIPIGEQPGSSWLYVYPRGILNLLVYIKEKYNDPHIYITENGVDQTDTVANPLPLNQARNDTTRIKYYHDHLSYISKAIRLGVKVEGYFAWSLMDNFEWAGGYTSRFGIYYTDYVNAQNRIAKRSVEWLRNFLQ